MAQQIDILYILGTGSLANDNLPLRWSLRSIDKYAKNLGRVVIAGYIPEWISDEIVKVPCEDSDNGKHWNILGTIAYAIRHQGMYRPFLYSSDDHYLCRAVDLVHFPRFTRGDCYTYEEYVRRRKRPFPPKEYQKSIMATRRILDEAHLSHRMACCHMNTWMDGRYLDEVLSVAELGRFFTPNYGPEPTCLFNAIHEKYHPQEIYTIIRDRKVIASHNIDEKIQTGYLGFSTTPKAEQNNEVISRMNRLLPQKSRFEK